ncbi:hypothetical protein ACFXG4_27055 [Nocardia sp. NPDC059246]|uniref:hypothetical protein n=1 Tax=unclassified Nocardia TaxID=2637762 RepID=UPI0036832F86
MTDRAACWRVAEVIVFCLIDRRVVKDLRTVAGTYPAGVIMGFWGRLTRRRRVVAFTIMGVVGVLSVVAGAVALGVSLAQRQTDEANAAFDASYDASVSSSAAAAANTARFNVRRYSTAENACEDLVRDQLKSPVTAQFKVDHDDLTGPDSDIRGTVSGTVDSQNGFGAMVRSDWGCTVMPGSTADHVISDVFYLATRN